MHTKLRSGSARGNLSSDLPGDGSTFAPDDSDWREHMAPKKKTATKKTAAKKPAAKKTAKKSTRKAAAK
jgi:hypothetical protein